MKNLAVIAAGKNTSQAFRAQLSDILGNRVNVTHYCLEEGVNVYIHADLALFSSRETYLKIKSRIAPECPVLIARRSINYHEVDKLFAIAPGTDVMLVNDFLFSAEETIALLRTMGVDHINYHPYAPEMTNYVRCPIAVTPGEKELTPPFVETIIDIKTRLIDIITLVKVLLRIDMLDAYADFLSANYVKVMIHLIRQGVKTVRESERMKAQFQAAINTVHEGIIVTDAQGRICVFNPVAEQLLALSARQMLGRQRGESAYDNLRQILLDLSDNQERLVKINGRQLVVNSVHLNQAREDGRLYTLKDVSEIRRLEEAVRRKCINEQKIARYSLDDIVGQSPAIQTALRAARKMADSDSTILIQGESGTGKELFAQGIHNASPRSAAPFVAVNFAALTENLLESELFGYVEGAFTGAARGGAPGLFEEAHKGTIFLDEIGDAPLSFQVKLLRVLQERQIRRVGSAKVIPIDVRVIVATNRDLKVLIANGRFRQDLYYRLHVLPIRVPPLRARGEDILHLAAFFYERTAKRCGLPSAAYLSRISSRLLRYDWPGNIRELQNVMEYLLHICPDAPPGAAMLPEEFNDCLPIAAAELTAQAAKELLLQEIAAANRAGRHIGRRSLAECLQIPENRVRKLLKEMEAAGLVDLQRGRQGLRLHDKDQG